MPQLLQAQIGIQTKLPQTPPIFWGDQDIDRHNSLPGRLYGNRAIFRRPGVILQASRNLCRGIRLGFIIDGRHDFGK
jgi:hypothetical protein